MSISCEKRSWFSRLNPFARTAEQISSRRSNLSRSSFRPSLEKLEDRLVLSPTLVTNTTTYPASAVVQILTTFPNGQMEQGTGTMVNQNTVLTAGHMVYNYSDGGWAKTIEVIAGRNGSKEPYGIAYGKYDETYNSFIADDKKNSNGHSAGDGDIAFVSLDRDLGKSTGWLGFMADSGTNYNVNKYGYPGTNGYNGTQMYYDYGKLNALGKGSASGFQYWGWSTSSMSAIAGESGSSLILSLNGKIGIVGVQDLGPSSGVGEGYAEVTTQSVINDLASFEKAHPAAPTKVSLSLSETPTTVLSSTSYGLANFATPSSSAPRALTQFASSSDTQSETTATSAVAPSSPAPAIAPQSPSAEQLFLDGITLAMDLSRPDGLSTALADEALMHDLDAAVGGAFNPYLDAGFLATLSSLHSSQNG